MSKIAKSRYTILPNIAKRWSPRSFSSEKIPVEKLKQLIEAGTWASSSFNEQPWRFLIGIKGEGEGYEKIFQCLNEKNQRWAKFAPVLMIGVAKKTFSKSGKVNRFHAYDTGQAVSLMAIQAVSENIYFHQVQGFDDQKSKALFSIPDEFDVMAAIAVGKLGPPEQLDEEFQTSEIKERSRKPVEEIAFKNSWGKSL